MTPAEWRETIGVLIEQHRGKESTRSAARRAGVDEAVWRQVEKGYRTAGGVRITANPRDDNLEAIAEAAGLDPARVFELAGRSYTPSTRMPSSEDRLSALEARVDEVEADVQALARHLDIERVTDIDLRRGPTADERVAGKAAAAKGRAQPAKKAPGRRPQAPEP